jgi:hypothetical protein
MGFGIGNIVALICIAISIAFAVVTHQAANALWWALLAIFAVNAARACTMSMVAARRLPTVATPRQESPASAADTDSTRDRIGCSWASASDCVGFHARTGGYCPLISQVVLCGMSIDV